MNRMRKILSGAALAAIVGLIALSAVASFWGADRARDLFNSLPLAVLWLALLTGLLAGPVVFRGLRSPSLLAIHLGAAIVLIGGMWSSQRAHELRARYFGSDRVRWATIELQEGVPDNLLRVHDPDGRLAMTRRLPFSLALADFHIEHYDPGLGHWQLAAKVRLRTRERPEGDFYEFPLDCPVGQAAPIPHTDLTVRVLEFLPQARPTPVLAVFWNDKEAELSAEPGQQHDLPQPGWTVRIVRQLSNLARIEQGGDIQVIDRPGPPFQPALEVRLAGPDREPSTHYVIGPQVMPPVKDAPNLALGYFMDAVADAESRFPALRVEVANGDHASQFWLLPTEAEHNHACLAWPAFAPDDPVQLGLLRVDPVSSYHSELAVLEEGRIVKQRVARVNHPFHHGGYHFYQADYDPFRNDVTYLRAFSDAGLAWFFSGLAVMSAGVFGACWLGPAIGWLKRRRSGRQERQHD